MTRIPGHVISIEGGGYTVDADYLAPRLDLSPDRLKAEMRAGLVTSVSEKGEGEDAGRVRLTFRYRARGWSVRIEPDGSAYETPLPETEKAQGTPKLLQMAEQAQRAAKMLGKGGNET